MNKFYTTAFCLLILVKISSAQGTWVQKASLTGTARMGAVAFTIGSKGYVGTGGDFFTVYYDDFWEYDPATDSWTQKANFPGGARYRAVGFAVGNFGYISTGFNGASYNDLWEYDPVANTWTVKSTIGALMRFGCVSFTIGNKAYTGTGTTGGYANDFWEYDPSVNVWTQKANFGGQPKIYATGFSIADKGYLGTGGEITNVGIGTNDIWEYDTTGNAWTQKANFPGTGVSEAVGLSVGSNGYIMTGTNNWGITALVACWKYYPVTDTWWQVADFPGTRREEAIGFVIDCKAYFGMGFTDDNSNTLQNDLWEYFPDSLCTAPPVSLAQASDTAFCAGTCISFDNLSINATSYQWNFFGGTPASSTDIFPTNICYQNAGTFDVVLIASNGIATDTLVLSNYITVFALPNAPSITQSGDTLFAPVGYNGYQWYFGSDTIAGATNNFYVAIQDGNYNLIVTDENGCSVGAGILNVVTSLTPALSKGEGVSVYPNPTIGKFEIEYYSERNAVVALEIFNTLGQIVFNHEMQMKQGLNSLSFAEGWGETGIYLLKISDGEKVMTKKIVIQR